MLNTEHSLFVMDVPRERPVHHPEKTVRRAGRFRYMTGPDVHETPSEKGNWDLCLYLVILAASALMVCGCQSEFLPTLQASPGAKPAGNSSSNTGSLKVDSSADSTYDPPPSPENIIEPGDQIQVTVWGHPQFNTTTSVENYGTISVPLLGNVLAEGLTESQLKKELKQRLSEYIKGSITITVSHVSMGKRVSVMGAVNKQGNYPALGDMSLVEVIADAGGSAPDADLRHIKIFSGGRRGDAQQVDLERYLQSGSIGDIPEVKPGDTVFVPAEDNMIREVSKYGEDVLVMFGFFSLLR